MSLKVVMAVFPLKDIFLGHPVDKLSWPWRTFTPLTLNVIYTFDVCSTCHEYSLTSVSNPPTILVSLWAFPQLQVVDTFAGDEVVALRETGLSVVVVVVVVGAEISWWIIFWCFYFYIDFWKIYHLLTIDLHPLCKESGGSGARVRVELYSHWWTRTCDGLRNVGATKSPGKGFKTYFQEAKYTSSIRVCFYVERFKWYLDSLVFIACVQLPFLKRKEGL